MLQHIMISVVAALPFSLAGFTGLLDPVFSVSSDVSQTADGFNLSFTILVLTTFVWAFPMSILWHRLYLLGPEHLIRRKAWPLITRSLKVISQSLVFFGFSLIMAVLVTGGLIYLRRLGATPEITGTITEMGVTEYGLYLLGTIILICLLVLIALRFSMAFASQAIGKNLGFTASWRMTRKNTFRMLIAALIGGLPIAAIVIFSLWVGKIYLNIDLWAGASTEQGSFYLFIIVMSPILTLPLALLCSLTASFYRHCGCAEYRASQN